MMIRSFTKHRNSKAVLILKKGRRMRVYEMSAVEIVFERESTQSSNACSRSCVMKMLDFRRRYMSFADLHSILFLLSAICRASFGADQFSFGTTDPPNSAIVS